jgi:hypothetical protein
MRIAPHPRGGRAREESLMHIELSAPGHHFDGLRVEWTRDGLRIYKLEEGGEHA